MLLWLLLAANAWGADKWVPAHVVPLGGIDQYHDSAALAPGDAQDAENVLTDAGYLEKRTGSIRIATILDGYAAKYAAQFVAPSNSKYLIAHASDNLYRTDLSSSGVVLVSTVSTGYNVDTTVAFGRLIVVDGNRTPFEDSGTATATVTGMPICALTEFNLERVYCANIPSESSSRVRVSSGSDRNGWTVPADVADIPDAPNSFDFQKDDGEGITCLKRTPWGMVVGKRHSMHILKGIDNLTFYKRIVDPEIGCVDDRSMQMVDGHLVWLGIDGIYSWSGAGPVELISRDIETLVKKIRQLNAVAGQWIVDSQSEWQAGTSDTNGPSSAWDTATTPGAIFPSSNTIVDTSSTDFSGGTFTRTSATDLVGSITLSSDTFKDDFADGNFTSGPSWTAASGGTCLPGACGGGWNIGSGVVQPNDNAHNELYANSNVSSGSFKVRINQSAGGAIATVKFISSATTLGSSGYAIRATVNGGGTATDFQILEYPGATALCAGSNDSDFPPAAYNYELIKSPTGYMQLLVGGTVQCSATDTSVSASSQVILAVEDSKSSFDNIDFYGYKDAGYFVSEPGDTLFSHPTGGPLTVSSNVPAGTTLTYQVRSASSSSGEWSGFTTYTYGQRITNLLRYQQYTASMTTTNSSTVTPSAQDFTLPYVSTGNYYSNVQFVGTGITIWKAVDWTDSAVPAGVALYDMRSATYSFPASTPNISWTRQGNHQTIRVSTGSYVQFRIDGTSMTTTSHTFQVSRAAVNWQEGTEKPVASGTIDHRYFLCVTLSSTSTVNDTCLVLQKNNKWVKYTGPSIAAMTLYDNNLVAGSGNTDSYMWKIMQKDVYRDDTSAISAFWTTPDYHAGNPFLNKIYYEIWVDAGVSASTMTVGYAANKSSSFTSKSLSLDVSTNHLTKRVPMDQGSSLGNYHRFKFSNATIDQYFRLNSFLFYMETKNRGQE